MISIEIIIDISIIVASVLGAIAIADGDIVVGIFAFVIIMAILGAIVGIIKFIVRKSKEVKREIQDKKFHQSLVKTYAHLSNDYLEHKLDMIMEIIIAHSKSVNGENSYIFSIFEKEKREGSYDGYYVIEGYLELNLFLHPWWDNVLYRYPDLKELISTTFTRDEYNHFTYNISVGSSTCCSFPTKKIIAQLHECLDQYEAKHPNVQFDRSNHGAKLINLMFY